MSQCRPVSKIFLFMASGLLVFSLSSCRPRDRDERNGRLIDFAGSEDLGWPSLNGPTGNNVSGETGLNWNWTDGCPQELWRCKVGTGYGSPVLATEHLILLHRVDDEEVIESFHPETGLSQWQYRYPTSYKCEFNYSDGPYSTPVIDGDCVYSVGAQGQLHCLRIEDGSLVWERRLDTMFPLPEQLFCVGASPLIEGDLLIFNAGWASDDAGVIAIEKATGQLRWTAAKAGPSYATPVAASIHDRKFVFVVAYEGLVALDPVAGTVLWEYPMRSNMTMTVNATSPVVYGDCVIMSTGPGPGTVCLRVGEDGGYEEIWRIRRGLDSQYNTLMLVDGYLYGFSSLMNHGSFRCVNAATGEEAWEYKSDLRRGQAIAVDDHFIVLGEFGHLATFEINPTKPILHSMTEDAFLEPKCFSAPVVYRGRLYLRNEGNLVCLDLR